ncbi:helix-turn-helix domain-containing protein, partial [Azospirillum argentinense]
VAEQTLAAFVRTPHRPLVGRVLLNRKESRPTAPAQPFFRILLGLTLKGISLKAGLHESAAKVALQRPWAAAQQAIADALNLSPEEIWPSRYSAQQEGLCATKPLRMGQTARSAARAAQASERINSPPKSGR